MNKTKITMALIGIALISIVVISGCTQLGTILEPETTARAISDVAFQDMPDVNLTESADLLPDLSSAEIRNMLADLLG